MEENDNWIEKFKRISWEPEILISGGMLYTLFQINNSLVIIKNYFSPLAFKGMNFTLGLLTLAISSLTIGFSLHLIMKASWVALLALKSVFRDGIDSNKLGYSDFFLQKNSINLTLDSKISKVGNASSLMFTVSFLSLFIFLGMVTYAIFWILIDQFLIRGKFPIEFVLIGLLILPFIDFITLGSLKKNALISKIYYPYYKFISWITFSFLYRDVLYTIISNISKKTIALFSVFFIVLTLYLSVRNFDSFTNQSIAVNNWSFFNKRNLTNSINERTYENLRNPNDPVFVTIQSDIIKDNHIKLYLNYMSYADWDLDSLSRVYPDLSTSQIINRYLAVKVNNIVMEDISWYFTRKRSIGQYGLIGYFSIEILASGSYVIDVRERGTERFYSIPFWKE